MKLVISAVICLFGFALAGCPGDAATSDADAPAEKSGGVLDKAEKDVRAGADEAVEKVESGKVAKDVNKGVNEAAKDVKGKLK